MAIMNNGPFKFETLILCGGKGTRLNTVVSDRPKIMADINGMPFIEYLFKKLENYNIKDIILCTGYRHEQIKKWVRNSYDGSLNVRFSLENKPLGTGGALKNAEHLINGEEFLVLNGDTFYDLEFNNFYNNFLKNKSIVQIALTKTNNPKKYGSININENNTVTDFEEKISGGESYKYINAGIYFFKTAIFDHIPSNTEYSLEFDVFPLLLKNTNIKISSYVTNNEIIDIGTPKTYLIAKEKLSDRNV